MTEGGQKDYPGIYSSGFRYVLRPPIKRPLLTPLEGILSYYLRHHFQRFPVEARAAVRHLRPWHTYRFHHPSSFLFSVQQGCNSLVILGIDALCQAKSGHRKTAVFVLATLQQLDPTENCFSVIVTTKNSPSRSAMSTSNLPGMCPMSSLLPSKEELSAKGSRTP